MAAAKPFFDLFASRNVKLSLGPTPFRPLRSRSLARWQFYLCDAREPLAIRKCCAALSYSVDDHLLFLLRIRYKLMLDMSVHTSFRSFSLSFGFSLFRSRRKLLYFASLSSALRPVLFLFLCVNSFEQRESHLGEEKRETRAQ